MSPSALKAGKVIFAVFLAFFAIRLFQYHFHLVTFPYSGTLREGTMMSNTDALVKGLNPYDMALQPKYANGYGIVYPLVVWPFAKAFGTTILVHRLVTAFFLLSSCALIFLVIQRMKIPVLLNIWAVLMLYASLLYPGTSTATIDPGATCQFFFLATVLVPWLDRYSAKSLGLSILCGIIAYYTKPYALLGIPVMASYLFFFISKKKGMYYAAAAALLAIASVFIVNNALPSYFDSCFFAMANMAPAWSTVKRLQMQLVMYTDLHKWLLMLIGAFAAGYAVKVFTDGHLKKNIRNALNAALKSLNWKNPQKPLISINVHLMLYAGTCSSIVLLLWLGKHTGATLWYFFQLLSPFFLVGCAWLFSQNRLWPLLCVPVLVYNLHTVTADEKPQWFSKNTAGWPEISMLVSRHQHILNSSLIVPLLIEQDKEFFDNGQAEYFLPGGDRTSWMKLFFKEDPRVSRQLTMFFYKIKVLVQNKAFDIILLQPGLLPGVGDDIRKNYKYEGEFPVYAPQDRRPYMISVWLLKN